MSSPVLIPQNRLLEVGVLDQRASALLRLVLHIAKWLSREIVSVENSASTR